MNRKILEDIKINNKKILTISKKDILDKDVSKKVPPYISTLSYQESSSKYDFLKKKDRKSPSATFTTKRIPYTPQMPSRSRPFNKIILFFFILSLIVGAFYLLFDVFFKAKVTVIPKSQSFELKHENFAGGKFKTDQIPFEVMVLSDSQTKDVVYTSSQDVSIKAKGEITLYNEYSNIKQTITAGTFISDEKGKSYKIDKTVSIPGYTLNKSKVIIPGQVTVGITAFLAGETYNGSPISFFINSFKGTTKYKKIYGNTKTPLTGGMVGLVYTLDDKEKEENLANTSLFKERLLRKLSAQVPVGYIFYPNSVNLSYEIIGDSVASKNPNTEIEIKGTISAFLIKEIDLSEFLIKRLLPNISLKEKSEIILPDLSVLSFNFVNKDQIVSKDIESFDFQLTGGLPINWKPNTNELKGLLIGKKKIEVVSIFKQDPGISSASVKIFPFWSKVLPENAKNINIIVK